MNDYISRIIFTKIKFLTQKAVLKVSLFQIFISVQNIRNSKNIPEISGSGYFYG